jgi:hypothetical protein
MKTELIIRGLAGSVILVSLGLAQLHSAHWLWLTALVGVNLLQSSFSNCCPAEIVLKKFESRKVKQGDHTSSCCCGRT